MLNDLIADIDRYRIIGSKPGLYYLLTQHALWAIAEYRYSHWVHTRVRIPVVRQLLRLVGFVWHMNVISFTGIDLPAETQIGRGFFIGHFGCVILSGTAKLGENCNISQGVTIGVGGRGENRGCPAIGDRVYIGPGAKLFGAITIGNDVAIGANAVVTKDLPDNAVAVGVPAKVISYDGSSEFIRFRK